MRLLHVISNMDPKLGGVSQAVRTMIVGLAGRGVHNEVVSLDASDSSWRHADSFTTHALGPSQGPWNYSSKLIPWLMDNLAQFDAVILHGLWLYHGYALRKALRHLKASHQTQKPHAPKLPRLFVMPHGMLDPYFQQATGRKLKAWRNWIYWKIIEGAIVNEAEGILFTCETERLLARQPFAPYHPHRELVVGLGVEEPPSYTPAMREAFSTLCPELRNRPYLLFLSRIHEKKGVDILLQAYSQLASTLATPTTFAQTNNLLTQESLLASKQLPILVIAGPGIETPYGQQMRQLATTLPDSTAVFFPGMLTGDAKWGAFYGCEAFVLPSHQENFGIAVVEALACSKPVLISNQVNIWREIEAMRGGIVAADTLKEILHLLERWNTQSISEKQTFEHQARLTYQQHFAITPAADRMITALQN